MKTTGQKHAELKKISKTNREGIYNMLKLTSEIFADHEYVDAFGGEGKLMAALEDEEYLHFGGTPGLASMLRAFASSPKRATWQEYNFNLRAMIDLSQPETAKQEGERINWKLRCAELEEKLAALEAVMADCKSTTGDLRTKCDELISANGELRGQVKLLRREPLIA